MEPPSRKRERLVLIASGELPAGTYVGTKIYFTVSIASPYIVSMFDNPENYSAISRVILLLPDFYFISLPRRDNVG